MNGISWGKIIFVIAVIAALIGIYVLWNRTPDVTSPESKDGKGMDTGDSASSTPPSPQPSPVSHGTVTPPPPPPAPKVALRVVSPNGGETWLRGKQYVVRWESSLPDATKVTLLLSKSAKRVTDPYSLDARTTSQQFEMFARSVFPDGLSNEGSYTYVVPQSLVPGTYQLLILAGDKCSLVLTQAKCAFDLSDGLFTIK